MVYLHTGSCMIRNKEPAKESNKI